MRDVLESVIIPSTLSAVEPSVFEECKCIKKFEFLEGKTTFGRDRGAASFWNGVFRKFKADEVVLPSTLAEMPTDIFEGCADLRVVRVAEGCPLDIGRFVGENVEVFRE